MCSLKDCAEVCLSDRWTKPECQQQDVLTGEYIWPHGETLLLRHMCSSLQHTSVLRVFSAPTPCWASPELCLQLPGHIQYFLQI